MKSLIKSLIFAILLVSIPFLSGCAFDDAYIAPAPVVVYRYGYGYGYWRGGVWCPHYGYSSPGFYRPYYHYPYGHGYYRGW